MAEQTITIEKSALEAHIEDRVRAEYGEQIRSAWWAGAITGGLIVANIALAIALVSVVT